MENFLDILETHLEMLKEQKISKDDTLYNQYFKPLDEHKNIR